MQPSRSRTLAAIALWLAAATTGAGADIAALARQVRGLGQAGDLLLAITIAGNEPADRRS